MNAPSKFSGDQLRLARLTLGYSLEELGGRVSATRQYLHQLETGSKQPTSEMQAAIAVELGVLPEFFELTGNSHVRPEQIHFRKQLTTPVSVSTQVVARGTMIDRLAYKLDEQFKLPRVNFPDFPASSLDEAERAAIAAREYWGLGADTPIISMMRVVENAGAIVTHFEGLSERVDALSMDRRRPIVVRGDAKASLCRQRFDLAHEAGHLIMHRGVETGDRKTEEQAHRFASAFLLPASAVFREFPRSYRLDWAAIFQMKLRWKVAARAIIRRAYDLGVINASQYRTGNIQLVKTGQSKEEKYDREMPLESPELLSFAIGTASRKPGRLLKLMNDLGFDVRMLTILSGENIELLLCENTANIIEFPKRKNEQNML